MQASVHHTGKQSNGTPAKIRPFGNSNGVILSSRIIEAAGFSSDADVLISVDDHKIIITECKKDSKINTNLASWDAAFKSAIAKGNKPEGDFFEGISNKFDHTEW